MTMASRGVDIIIPTYKPDAGFIRCLELLGAQDYPISHIYIINTGRTWYEELTERHPLPASVRDITQVFHITPDKFDHGGTRRRAVLQSDADIFVMMTQDALPSDTSLISKLVAPLDLDPAIAVSYARQLPASGASETERYVRSFNYPDTPVVKSYQDVTRLGVKTYFCSNVCAAYRRSAYDDVGGFVDRTIFNEDMILAASLVKKGYLISYTASACVYHSHNYTCRQQFKRNFDLAVSQAEHPEVFAGVSSEAEGKRMVAGCIAHLRSIHKPWLIPGFIMNCGARFIGYRLGRRYRIIPRFIVRRLSAQPLYWS